MLQLMSELKPSIESLARCKLIGLDERLGPEGLWWRTSDGTLDVFARPLRQAADIEAEKARLLKEVQKIEGEIKVLKARLDNQGFREHAPALVISEHLERMESLSKKRDSALEHIRTIQDHDSGVRS
jgi:valyl-tRNA synthetase